MAALLINPRYALFLWKWGLRSFHDFMGIEDGILVGGHRQRDVRQLTLDQLQVFLKKEYVSPWKDALTNWWSGFGWVSKARREWQLLIRLRELGFFAPEPMAMGERKGQAFLMLRALPMAVDLPRFLAAATPGLARRKVLEQLADTLARFHNAGFLHADLYAKHVFIGTQSSDVAFVDFQRSRYSPRGTRLAERMRDLASLSASLHEAAVTPRERMAFYARYWRSTAVRRQRQEQWAALRAIRQREAQLLKRNKIRKMRQATIPPALEGDAMPAVSYWRVSVDATAWLPSLRVVQPHESSGEGPCS